jgi:hypothetical protein
MIRLKTEGRTQSNDVCMTFLKPLSTYASDEYLSNSKHTIVFFALRKAARDAEVLGLSPKQGFGR